MLIASRQSLCASFIMNPGLKSPFERPLVHRDGELVVPRHRRLQHADHRVEREPRLHAGYQRLDDCLRTMRREQVVDELHRLAGAELAAMEEVGAHAIRAPAGTRAIRLGVAPTISVSVPATACSAVLPTGLSIIAAPFGDHPPDALRRRGIDRAHVDVDAAGPDALDDAVGAERHPLDVGRIGQHRDDDVARPATSFGDARGLRARPRSASRRPPA